MGEKIKKNDVKIDKNDIVGNRYGKVVVVKYLYLKNGKHWYWIKCDCGNEKAMARGTVVRSKSCGCMKYGSSARPRNSDKVCEHCKENPVYAVGLCRSCYGRFRRTGSPAKKESIVKQRKQEYANKSNEWKANLTPNTEIGRQWLREFMDGKSARQIAKENNVSYQMVYYRMNQQNIDTECTWGRTIKQLTDEQIATYVASLIKNIRKWNGLAWRGWQGICIEKRPMEIKVREGIEKISKALRIELNKEQDETGATKVLWFEYDGIRFYQESI